MEWVIEALATGNVPSQDIADTRIVRVNVHAVRVVSRNARVVEHVLGIAKERLRIYRFGGYAGAEACVLRQDLLPQLLLDVLEERVGCGRDV